MTQAHGRIGASITADKQVIRWLGRMLGLGANGVIPRGMRRLLRLRRIARVVIVGMIRIWASSGGPARDATIL